MEISQFISKWRAIHGARPRLLTERLHKDSISQRLQIASTRTAIDIGDGFEAAGCALQPEPHVITSHWGMAPPLYGVEPLLEAEVIDGVQAAIDGDADADSERPVQLTRLGQQTGGSTGQLSERGFGFAQAGFFRAGIGARSRFESRRAELALGFGAM